MKQVLKIRALRRQHYFKALAKQVNQFKLLKTLQDGKITSMLELV